MRKTLIDGHIQKLSKSFGGVKHLIPKDDLHLMYRKRDFPSMVRYIRASMNLEVRVMLGYVNSGGPENAGAWIEKPEHMPLFGTNELRHTVVKIYIPKQGLEFCPFESIVRTFAHELSHVVLDCIRHELSRDEVAVDLTAMILGYRYFFKVGSVYTVATRRLPQSFFERITDRILGPNIVYHEYKRGYLSQEEVDYAFSIMDRLSIYR